MGWLRNKLNLVEVPPPQRATQHEDFEMEVRVEEALAASAAASRLAQEHAEEAQRLFGTIRREIHNTKAVREAEQ